MRNLQGYIFVDFLHFLSFLNRWLFSGKYVSFEALENATNPVFIGIGGQNEPLQKLNKIDENRGEKGFFNAK